MRSAQAKCIAWAALPVWVCYKSVKLYIIPVNVYICVCVWCERLTPCRNSIGMRALIRLLRVFVHVSVYGKEGTLSLNDAESASKAPSKMSRASRWLGAVMCDSAAFLEMQEIGNWSSKFEVTWALIGFDCSHIPTSIPAHSQPQLLRDFYRFNSFPLWWNLQVFWFIK